MRDCKVLQSLGPSFEEGGLHVEYRKAEGKLPNLNIFSAAVGFATKRPYSFGLRSNGTLIASMRIRLSVRRCVTLVAALIALVTFGMYALRSSGHEGSHFDFIEHAIHKAGRGGFYETHNDGTGGWLTRWFTSPSQSSFLGKTRHQLSLAPRCPVYTYIDTTTHHRGSDESAILLVWMRAFWSLGFKPVILTDKDARKHARYGVFKTRGLVSGSRLHNFGKWLAMSQHGGLFVDYRVLYPPYILLTSIKSIPMPTRNNVQFAILQNCKFGHLTAYKSTGEQVVHGTQQEYEKIIQHVATDSENFGAGSQDRPIFDVINSLFDVQPTLEGIATYSEVAVAKLYPSLKSELLPSLISAHLHEHFLRMYPVLTVIDPTETQPSSLFRQRATAIAKAIAACPNSPQPGTCPPGSPRCKPCKSATVDGARSLNNIHKTTFLFATVPHPLTYLSYVHQKPNLDPRFVRGTRRDEWVESVTSEMVDKQMGGYQRMELLQDYVASETAILSDKKKTPGLWQTWEEMGWDGLPIVLGFQLDDALLFRTIEKVDEVDAVALAAKDRVLSQGTENGRDMVESWNLAYTELWYFIRAWQRQRKSERLDLQGSFAF